MNRLYAVESTPSLTGAKADHRLPMRASDVEGFARQLAAAVGVGGRGWRRRGEQTPPGSPRSPRICRRTAARSLVIAGEYQPAAVHALAHAMNQALGNVGATVDLRRRRSKRRRRIRPPRWSTWRRRWTAGKVELLVILGGNPVFTAPADLKFAEALAKVPLAVYHGLYVDETAQPLPLEHPGTAPPRDWGDARAYDGTVTLMQPLIAPLYEGRSAHEVLGALAGQSGRAPLEIVKDYWTRAFNGQGGLDASATPTATPSPAPMQFWKHALHDGFIRGTSIADGGPATPFAPAPKAAARGAAAAGARGRRRLQRATPAAGPAHAAGAPRRQPQPRRRLPPPAPPARPPPRRHRARDHLPARPDGLGRPLRQQRLAAGTAQAADQDHLGHLGLDAPGARRSARPRATATSSSCATAAARRGCRSSGSAGIRASRSRCSSATAAGWPAGSATPSGIAEQFNAVPAADVRRAVVRHRPRDRQDRRALPAGDHPGAPPDGRARARCASPTLDEYLARAEGHRRDGREAAADADADPRLRVQRPQVGHGDRPDACTGCGACTIACKAENNIPVVGKEQVARGREMHWIRVDHYYTGDPRARRPGAVGAPAGALHAVRERAVRAGLPGRPRRRTAPKA